MDALTNAVFAAKPGRKVGPDGLPVELMPCWEEPLTWGISRRVQQRLHGLPAQIPCTTRCHERAGNADGIAPRQGRDQCRARRKSEAFCCQRRRGMSDARVTLVLETVSSEWHVCGSPLDVLLCDAGVGCWRLHACARQAGCISRCGPLASSGHAAERVGGSHGACGGQTPCAPTVDTVSLWVAWAFWFKSEGELRVIKSPFGTRPVDPLAELIFGSSYSAG